MEKSVMLVGILAVVWRIDKGVEGSGSGEKRIQWENGMRLFLKVLINPHVFMYILNLGESEDNRDLGFIRLRPDQG